MKIKIKEIELLLKLKQGEDFFLRKKYEKKI
jgi:hypothetical protein